MSGQALRAWRKRLGLTQAQAGEILGVTPRAVAKWEAGQAPIDKRTQLATQMYEQQYITRHGINGLPLLYAVYVAKNSKDEHVGDTYLVIARQDYEASKLVYGKLGEPESVTLTAVWAGKAPTGSTPRILGRVAEMQSAHM
jgi:transcriptional regulator with XRE-family HTH domain